MTKTHFPAVVTWQRQGRWISAAGLRLEALTKRSLVEEKQSLLGKAGFQEPSGSLSRREAMLQALAGWPSTCTLEISSTTLPDLGTRSRGETWITLTLLAEGDSEEAVGESVLKRILALFPLCETFFPEAEFAPINDPEELKTRRAPFTPKHALAVTRRRETLSLARSAAVVGFRSEAGDRPFGQTVSHTFPWIPSQDDWSGLLSVLLGQIDPLSLIVRIRPCPLRHAEQAKLQQNVKDCEAFLQDAGEHHPTLARQLSALQNLALERLLQLPKGGFKVGVFLTSSHPLDASLPRVVGRSLSTQAESDTKFFSGGYAHQPIAPDDLIDPDFFPEQDAFTIQETAAAFRLPSPPEREFLGLPVRRYRTSLAPGQWEVESKGSIEVVRNVHRAVDQPVFLSPEDRMRHCFILGQTGMGKSTIMEHMVLQDIRAGRGVAVIDPPGEMVESLLPRIPKERMQDVIYFNVLDEERPLGFNLIEWHTPKERDLVVDELYLTIDRLYDLAQTGGPIFESNFRGMLRLLMGDSQRDSFVPTLLEFIRCYADRQFRRWLRKTQSDPQVEDFLKELERTGGDAALQNLAPYITSKLGRFVNDETLKHIIGQSRTSIDFDAIMNQGKILLVNLGKGRFGSVVSALLSNALVSRFKLATLRRGNMAPEERRDFFLYVDEAHNLPGENFTELLSEARKYRMGLTLATQYTDQLSQGRFRWGSPLLPAILGNVGAIFLLRLGRKDAELFAPLLEPVFSAQDLTGLPRWKGYATTLMGSEAPIPFSFSTVVDPARPDADLGAQIRELSRERHGIPVEEVQQAILQRRKVLEEDED